MHMSFKKGLVIAMTAGLLGTNGLHAKASDSLEQAETAVCQTENITFPTTNGVLGTSGLFTPVQNTEEEDTSIIVEETDNEDFIVKEQNGKYENTGFVNLSSDYLYVRSSTSDDSDWTGKLYPGNVVTLEGPVGEWTAIRSGNVTGFVRSENLMEMKSAQQKIRQMEAEALKNGTEVTFSYGETKEEEASRLQAEAEQRAREEAERKQAQRQAVVDYACQFIGNPYVWGGTSLTNGADCSGFVQSVYAHFGVSLPRTSSAQRSAGYAVSYSEAQPGDIICYNGHVGIYSGNGQIVNAQDPAHGIGISPATYTSIVTVRRIF